MQPSSASGSRSSVAAARAAVLGVNDGLVTNLCLILAVAGADIGAGEIRVAGLASLIAGVLDGGRRVDLGAQPGRALRRDRRRDPHPRPAQPAIDPRRADLELRDTGLATDTAQRVATELPLDDERFVSFSARTVFGFDTEQLGSPTTAAVSSLGLFAVARWCRSCRGSSPAARRRSSPRSSPPRWRASPSVAGSAARPAGRSHKARCASWRSWWSSPPSPTRSAGCSAPPGAWQGRCRRCASMTGVAELLALDEAVARLVRDGDTVAMEGFTHLIPHAAGHEIIRQGRRHLHLVRMTPDVVYDQLIGAGCVERLTFSWGGNPGVGSLQRFRDAVENGWPRPLQIEEHSHAGMATRYAAGAAGLPFGCSARLRRHRPRRAHEHDPADQCPFTGERLTAVPALNPDVSVIHAQRADREGNVQIWGLVGVQKEAVLAAALDRDGRADRRRARSNSEQQSCCRVGGQPRCARCRAVRTLLRHGLLVPRQRLLPRVGRDLEGSRSVRRVDRRERARHPRPRRVHDQDDGSPTRWRPLPT